MSSYADSYRQAVAYEYNTDFSKVLQQRMDYFSNDSSADVINRVRGEITQVRGLYQAVVYTVVMFTDTINDDRSLMCTAQSEKE